MGIGGILIIVSKEANRITMPITELLVMLYEAKRQSPNRRGGQKTQIELLIACVLDFTVRLLYTFIC